MRARRMQGRVAWLRGLLPAVLPAALLAGAARAEPVRLDPAEGLADARAVSEVLRDPGGRWDIADVLARHDRFLPSDSVVPDLGVSAFAPGTLWFRLQPRSDAPGPWFVEVSPEVDRAELVLVGADGGVRRESLGMAVPAAGRVPPLANTTAMLPDGALRDGTLYLRMVGREDLNTRFGLRPAVWEATVGRARAEAGLLPRLVLIGLVGGLGLFNLLLGATLREQVYLRYAAAMAGFALYAAADCGIAWRWLWPTLPLPYDVTVGVLYSLYLALTLGFARSFLDPGSARPREWRAAWAAWWGVALFQAVNTLAPNLVDRAGLAPLLDPLLSGMLFAAVLACGVAPCRARQPGAGAYLAAFSLVSLGLMVGLLGDYQVITRTPWTNAAPGLGVGMEALLLAVSMGQRMLLLRGERDRLAALALTDALTGIANRRSFDLRLAEEWRRAARGGTPLAVVMFDVDCFKAYNDRYGHAAGDSVLAHVATAASRSLGRGEDCLARYGGEEFAAVLPGASAAVAAAVAERIRGAVESLRLAHPANCSGCVTLSGGVASSAPEHGLRAQDLLRAADDALYEAKHAGRNQVRVATHAPEPQRAGRHASLAGAA